MSRPQLSVNQRHEKQKPVSGFKRENGLDVLRFSRIYSAPAIETNQRNCNYSLNMIFLQEINLLFVQVFGDEKMTTALLNRIVHHCDILETGNDSIDLIIAITRSTTKL